MAKLARKNLKTGKVSARPRGRPAPGYLNGYLDEGGEFMPGNPPKGKRGRKRMGRPPGRKTAGHAVGNGRGLSEIERIVAAEVAGRLKAAKAAALKAFSGALGV